MDSNTLNVVGLVYVPIGCAVFAAVFALTHQWVTEKAREKREAQDKAEEQRLRLWAFAHEAVGLHRRWTLYARQIHRQEGLSASRPYEWISPSALNAYMRVGASNRIVQAVVTIKQLNAQVTLQLDRAQASARSFALLSFDSPDRNAFAGTYLDDLERIIGFIFSPDEWKPACDAIELLLNAASDRTDVSDLRASFEAQREEADRILVEREARAAARQPKG